MRILIVTQYFWPENFKVNDLARELHRSGHEVSVLTGLPNYPKGYFYKGYSFFKGPFKEELEGIRIFRVPITPRRNGTGIKLFINYISYAFFASFYARFKLKNEYDKIIVFEISPVTVGIPAIIVSNRFKIPIYFWVLDLWPESIYAASNFKKRRIINYFLEKLVTYIYKKSHLILVSSRSFVESITNKNIQVSKIKYFPNWAEDIFLNKTVLNRENIIQFPKGFNILYAGNIGESQDFENVLIGFSNYHIKYGGNVNLIFIGNGRKRIWLEQEIVKRNLTKNVYYLGSYPIEDVPYFYEKADVLFASLKNKKIFNLTVPAKLQTYMAAKKPILAMISGEGNNLVKEANCGLVVESSDHVGFTKKINEFANMSQDQLNEMSANAFKFYMNNFSKDVLMLNLKNWLENN